VNILRVNKSIHRGERSRRQKQFMKWHEIGGRGLLGVVVLEEFPHFTKRRAMHDASSISIKDSFKQKLGSISRSTKSCLNKVNFIRRKKTFYNPNKS
jgi:hypothetical protein